MRLRDMKSIIDHELPIIKTIRFSEDGIGSDRRYILSNFHTAQKSFDELMKIDLFSNTIKQLFTKYPYLSTVRESFNVDATSFQNIQNIISGLRQESEIVSKILVQLLDEQDPYTISFRLFEFENFAEYAKFCDDLSTKILNPLNRLNIKVELGELEIGSKWVSIIIGASIGVALFTAIVRQSFDILIHDYQKYRAAESVMHSLKDSGKLLEEYNKSIIEKIKEENTVRASSVAEELKSHPEWEKYSEMEPSELENSVRISMDLLSKYIDKGLEIYQALDVDEKDRYQLPDYKELLQVKESQKLLRKNDEQKLLEEKDE
jgi:hypothetical protein